MTQRLLSFGVELEGCFLRSSLPNIFHYHHNTGDMSEQIEQEFLEFRKKYNCVFPEGHKIFRSDGSVYFSTREIRDKFGDERTYIGEIASPIFFELKDMLKFIEDFHPLGNNSTGCHIHIKPTLGDYQNAVMQYTKFKNDYLKFIEYLGIEKKIPTSAQYFKRVNGIRWCQRGLSLRDVKHQLTNEVYRARYKHINFCWTKKSTIELRSFPIFESKTLQKTIVKDVIKYFNTWFLLNEKKPKILEVNV